MALKMSEKCNKLCKWHAQFYQQHFFLTLFLNYMVSYVCLLYVCLWLVTGCMNNCLLVFKLFTQLDYSRIYLLYVLYIYVFMLCWMHKKKCWVCAIWNFGLNEKYNQDFPSKFPVYIVLRVDFPFSPLLHLSICEKHLFIHFTPIVT